MVKLNDYSGEFLPDLKFGDFSQEGMVKMLYLFSRLYRAMDGFWYLAIKEKMGNEEALDRDLWVWDRVSRYEMKNIVKQFNIPGNDVTALMKAIQLSPWFWQDEIEIEIEDRNTAIFTARRCKVLEYMEKEGEGREQQICHVVEPRILNSYASFFSPDIKVKCLKMPPRQGPGDICCRWRFSKAPAG
jgi:hypothetical protein